MLFKLAPLLLSSLFFSYVAGIPVHGSNPATAGAGASGVSAGGADSGWRDMFEDRSTRPGEPIKENAIYLMFTDAMYFIVSAPTKRTPAISISIYPTNDVKDVEAETVDLKDVENAELRKYSAIIREHPLSIKKTEGGWKIMKEEIAAQARPLIMAKYDELSVKPSESGKSNPGPSIKSDSDSKSESDRFSRRAGPKLRKPGLRDVPNRLSPHAKGPIRGVGSDLPPSGGGKATTSGHHRFSPYEMSGAGSGSSSRETERPGSMSGEGSTQQGPRKRSLVQEGL